jgi:ribonuclease HI
MGVYTDASAINGKVGASAVIPATGFAGQAYLGKNSNATVYLAELGGIQMAALMALTLQKDVIIFSDSQTAAKAVQDPHINGQQILTP